MSRLFNRTPREAALELIRRALAEELGASPTLLALAENIDAIAEAYRERTEDVLVWIHTPAPGKQWTGAEFRRWCQLRRELREEA
jgi:hypothetical protein